MSAEDGSCGAELHFGLAMARIVCQLSTGHFGDHVESGTRKGHEVRITWASALDERLPIPESNP